MFIRTEFLARWISYVHNKLALVSDLKLSELKSLISFNCQSDKLEIRPNSFQDSSFICPTKKTQMFAIFSFEC